jgi:CheY-like chemotaxis protein/anti-sigma regulatory factor (Ser/Thr protein kinase)
VDIDAGIPPYIHSDEQRLAQVITNLLTNAVKFTPENGEIRLAARLISISRDNAEIEISVKDTGIGISAEQQAKLFTVFQQAESSIARKYGGTGLGLAISKRIVEMMEGTIQVESEPGHGSRFSFQICVGTAEAPKTIADISADSPIENAFEGKCILLAEDIEINREIVRSLLEPTAVEIVDAVNGRDAVEKFAAEPEKYDIIFMDVQMPELDGYDATRRIRAMAFEKANSIPIIAMTANVFKEDIDKCLNAGMNAHIGKPIDMGQVLEKLRLYI